MRSIGAKWKKEVKRLVNVAKQQGLTGVYKIENFVTENIDGAVYDTWEASHSEITRIIDDYVLSGK